MADTYITKNITDAFVKDSSKKKVGSASVKLCSARIYEKKKKIVFPKIFSKNVIMK